MLEKYFREEDWIDYIEFFEERKYKYDMLEDFEKIKKELNNDRILAIIIWELIGSQSVDIWLHNSIDALGNKKPIDCINDANLLNRLKVLLMRLPC